jgi:thiol-disulfide isomerase/thioredoxin
MYRQATKMLSRLAALCTVVLALGGCGRESAAPPAPLAPAADPLVQARDEWLLINYWAEWCKPCLEEIPELNAFAREHATRARVLMVNYDGVQGAQLLAQAKRLGIETTLLDSDPAARFGYQRPQVLPVTYVIAPAGRVHGTLIGPQTGETLLAAIEGG